MGGDSDHVIVTCIIHVFNYLGKNCLHINSNYSAKTDQSGTNIIPPKYYIKFPYINTCTCTYTYLKDVAIGTENVEDMITVGPSRSEAV